MKRFYLDSGGIPCDLEKFDKDNPLSSVVNAEQAVALLNQFQSDLKATREDKATLQSIIDSMQTDLTRLRTDLEAARAENKIQARMIEAMARRVSDAFGDCPYGETDGQWNRPETGGCEAYCEQHQVFPDSSDCYIVYYREQAEQTNVAGGGATDDGTPVKIEETEGK